MIRRRRNNAVPQIWLLSGEQKGQGMDERDNDGIAGRRLIRHARYAALATSMNGHPYASLVALACDHDSSPMLLLSNLAQHSRNIAADNRASLLFDGNGGDHLPASEDRLAQSRLTVLGQAARCNDPHLLARFTARHPSAAAYAGFSDFHLYRVTIGRGHLVAGFGQISWIEGDALRLQGDASPLSAAEADIVQHMNADHADAIALFAERLLGRSGAGWSMTGIDPEGVDMRSETETGRLDFPAAVLDPAAARQALIALAQAARAAGN
jgi:putative heme iron utilization protein